MIRSLIQPGPTHPSRIECILGEPRSLTLRLHPGATLNEALTGPLVTAGFQSGAITMRDVALGPFRYVTPAPAADASHVAYFSAPVSPSGTSRVELANATLGWAGGAPFVHCHAVWREADGSRRGGHILPHETFIAAAGEARAWGFASIRMQALPDPETNFSIFQPSGASDDRARGVVARIKPNQDILTAIETLAAAHGIRNAVVRGSLGSLVGARFNDGRVDDHATEVLVRHGAIQDSRAALDMLVADMGGRVHEGWLEHGQNPVCITFELVLEAVVTA